MSGIPAELTTNTAFVPVAGNPVSLGRSPHQDFMIPSTSSGGNSRPGSVQENGESMVIHNDGT